MRPEFIWTLGNVVVTHKTVFTSISFLSFFLKISFLITDVVVYDNFDFVLVLILYWTQYLIYMTYEFIKALISEAVSPVRSVQPDHCSWLFPSV